MEEVSENSGITRLESARTGTFGWQVRIQRRSIRYAKYFADRGYGGRSSSLLAAREWRDRLLTEIQVNESARVCSRSPRNSSGVVGVSKVTISGPKGLVYYFWQATWAPASGERRTVRFSIRRHGEEGAFDLAVQARREGIGL